jgi:hypothetical protein
MILKYNLQKKVFITFLIVLMALYSWGDSAQDLEEIEDQKEEMENPESLEEDPSVLCYNQISSIAVLGYHSVIIQNNKLIQ